MWNIWSKISVIRYVRHEKIVRYVNFFKLIGHIMGSGFHIIEDFLVILSSNYSALSPICH